MNKIYAKFLWLVFTMIFTTCRHTTEETNSIVDFKRSPSSIVGEWEVTHAEVIYSNQGVKQETINQVEKTANRYEYRFFKDNKFERGQPETFRVGVEEMHGMYKIDSVNQKIKWFLEYKSASKDTTTFDYIEINSNKIVLIEPYGTSIKVLKILNRKKRITEAKIH